MFIHVAINYVIYKKRTIISSMIELQINMGGLTVGFAGKKPGI